MHENPSADKLSGLLRDCTQLHVACHMRRGSTVFVRGNAPEVLTLTLTHTLTHTLTLTQTSPSLPIGGDTRAGRVGRPGLARARRPQLVPLLDTSQTLPRHLLDTSSTPPRHFLSRGTERKCTAPLHTLAVSRCHSANLARLLHARVACPVFCWASRVEDEAARLFGEAVWSSLLLGRSDREARTAEISRD